MCKDSQWVHEMSQVYELMRYVRVIIMIVLREGRNGTVREEESE